MNRLRYDRRTGSKRVPGWVAVGCLATLSLVECSDIGAIHGQTRARNTEEKGMDVTKLRLTATSREKSEHLYPEQSAFFDFSLLNAGSAPAEVMAFYGNDTTPVYRIFDSAGKLTDELGIRDLERRFNADMGDPVPQPPRLMKIAAGKSRQGWVDLWSYRAPLPAGHYQFAMAHRFTPGAELIESNRVPFQVVDAEVADVALGYAEQDHSTSLMAWLASAPGGGEGRILMRQSSTLKHNSAQRSGMPIGPASIGTRLALGLKPASGPPTQEGWLAIVRGGSTGPGSVELLQTFEAAAAWSSKPIALPVDNAQPVAGFPDRGGALFLATGTNGGKPALAGVKVDPDSIGKAWRTPLGFRPVRAACIFGASGPVTVVLAGQDNRAVRLALLQVGEDGSVSLAERDVWGGEGDLVELTADMRADARPSILALIADPHKPDHLKLVRITATGETGIRDFGAIPGWPTVPDHAPDPDDKTGKRTVEVRRPAKIRRAQMAVNRNAAFLAMVDEQGYYYGGPLGNTPLALLAGGERAPRVVLPQIVVLGRDAFFSGFTDRGALAHFGTR